MDVIQEMRYTVLTFIAHRLPHQVWGATPQSWRDWWAAEWVIRYRAGKTDR